MADTLDTVRKLIALALHNPHAEEAASAAMMACRLLEHHEAISTSKKSIPLNKPYKQDEDFEQVMSEVEAAMKRTNPDEFKPTIHVDNDVDDDFMRTRIKKAWQQIRDQRAALQAEIHHYEVQTGRRFRRLEES